MPVTSENPHREQPLPFRLAEPGEGIPIIELIAKRAGGFRSGSRMVAFLQEWDRLADELERQPTVGEYAERWGVSRATAHRDLATFRELFPTEQTPRRLLALLWDGLSTGHMSLMAVPVVSEDDKE